MNAVASTGPTEGVYAAADALLTHRANSFTWARRFLSPVHGERATRLYGFCRRVDDLADDNNCALSAGSALSAVRAALESGASANEALSDMLTLMRDCHIDPAIPLDLITGVESDLGEVRLAPGTDWKSNLAMQQAIAQVEAKLADQGRVLIRASGTEPVVRVMVEARDAQVAKASAERIAQTLQ
jgi:hypothetical protein